MPAEQKVSQERFTVLSDGPSRTYEIRPSDIPLRSMRMAGRFWKAEIEAAAGMLVLFFQSRGCWGPFTISELRAFYLEKGENPDTMFYGLLGVWFDRVSTTTNPWNYPAGELIIQGHDGHYYVTNQFVDLCMRQ